MADQYQSSDQLPELVDLMPLETLEQLRELFESTVGVPLVFTDADGRTLTSVAEPLCFCGTLVPCEHQDTVCLRRQKWDVPEAAIEGGIRRSHDGGGPTAHRCLGGFRDAAVPILVENAQSQVRGLAVSAGHELVTDVPADCPDLQADGDKLVRVLVNLLGNAIKFTPDGGRIRVSAQCDDTGVTFAVEDNGPGLPPEYHEKIFDKFGQVEARQAKGKHSTGLGLTFCKMVCEAHGDRIWVESEVGNGCTFFVFIPAERTPNQE